jgi:hypothetical protein
MIKTAKTTSAIKRLTGSKLNKFTSLSYDDNQLPFHGSGINIFTDEDCSGYVLNLNNGVKTKINSEECYLKKGEVIFYVSSKDGKDTDLVIHFLKEDKNNVAKLFNLKDW